MDENAAMYYLLGAAACSARASVATALLRTLKAPIIQQAQAESAELTPFTLANLWFTRVYQPQAWHLGSKTDWLPVVISGVLDCSTEEVFRMPPTRVASLLRGRGNSTLNEIARRQRMGRETTASSMEVA